MGRRPTIIDVAKLAGVSKSTAARALSDSPDVNDTTRDKVRKAAIASGYERNHLAVGMRSGRSGLFGLVIPDITNPFWAEVARGAQDIVGENGASLLVFSSDWDHDREASHLRALRQAGFRTEDQGRRRVAGSCARCTSTASSAISILRCCRSKMAITPLRAVTPPCSA